MPRARAGRARFTSNDRAIVRKYPTTEKLEMRNASKIDNPGDLVDACEEAGAKIRRTTSGGHLVQGPTGTAVVPPKWDNRGRMQANTLSAVRRAGIDLHDADPPRKPKPKELATVVDIPAQHATTAPAQDQPSQPAPTQDDVDALLELVSHLTSRVDTLVARGDTLSARVDTLTARCARLEKAASESSGQDRFREARDRIMAWFRTLPTGMVVTSGVITGNLGVDGDPAEVGMYRRQLAKLVELGQLKQHGGGRGGSAAHYSLADPEETDEGANDGA